MTRKERKNEKTIGISFRDTTGLKKPVTVARSKSFAGMSTGSGSQPSTPILGETLRHSPRSTLNSRSGHSTKSLGVSTRKMHIKMPKVPRPHRALIMFESVKRGIREFIQATQNDVAQLQTKQADSSISQGKSLELDKQVKAAERYLKRLEFHLTKLEELQECYMIQQQLREGVRTMAQAYVTSPGKRKESLTNVKFGYKECSQTMCAIEAQLESMLGVLHCKLQGMAGFARICPGDVFQVTLCYGLQKWKSRGKMEKDGTQKWDAPNFAFKALVGDVISIKGVEVRSFKSVVLGQKCCETRDLFSANPQLMTVNINTNGSIKLSVIVTWNPLEGVDDTLSYYEVPSRPQATPRQRPVSMLALNGDQLSTSDWDLGPDRRFSSPLSYHKSLDDRDSPYGSHKVLSPSPLTNSPVFVKDSKTFIMPNRTSFPPDIVRTSLPTTTLPPPLLSQNQLSGGYGQVTVSRDDPNNLEDALNNLSTTLEDFQGQYSELQKLEELVVTLEHMLRRHSRCSSQSSIISVSIESALEAFDFLNTEEAIEELELPPASPDHSKSSSLDLMMASPESTAKTADSGIESLAKRLSEDTQLGSSMGSSPIPPTTGNDQVDQALLFHLVYCEKLLDNLGNFGPLRCREIYALDKLQQQSDTLANLVKIAKSGTDIDLHEVLSELTNDKQLREFWVKCVDHNILYVQPEKLHSVFEQKYAAKIQEKYEIKSERVFQHIISRTLDIPSFDQEKYKPTNVITVFQLMHHFKEVGGLKTIDIVSEELFLSDRLCSGNPDITIKAILQLRATLPSAACLKLIGTLLVSVNREIRQSAGNYLKLVMKKSETREAAVVIFVEGLEDRTADIRSGSCVALSLLEATESVDQLVYLCQTDVSAAVRSRAKEALYSYGDDGRKAFEEANLASHGFQGIQMKRK